LALGVGLIKPNLVTMVTLFVGLNDEVELSENMVLVS
jgi:N-acetylglutamate synthase/N-acetylornithine aminotransferase